MFEMLTRTVDDVNTHSRVSSSSAATTVATTAINTTTDESTAGDELGESAHSVSSAAAVERVATIGRCAKLSKLLFGRYVFAAIIDVYGNFLIIMAYNYTTITSIMLLDCFTIPVAMLLSYFFLDCRYNAHHMLGVSLCLLGLICIVISDAITQDQHQAGSNPLVGDLLCLAGSALYGCSNVLQEYLVKYHDRDEFMGFLGCCGAVISFAQFMSTDYPRIRHARYTTNAYLCTAGFVGCLFLMYVNTSSFLQEADSTLFNLSLLTSDVYAVVFSYFFYGYLVHWLYFVSFSLVAVGLVIYHSTAPPIPGYMNEGHRHQRLPVSVIQPVTAADLEESSGTHDGGVEGELGRKGARVGGGTYNPLSSEVS
jgi:solute carrier family 35 protein F1/2